MNTSEFRDAAPNAAGDDQASAVLVVPPHGELPPGFPLTVTELVDLRALLAWQLESGWKDSGRQVLRLNADLLRVLRQLRELIDPDELSPLRRIPDVTGPVDGVWLMKAHGLAIETAASLMRTRDEPAGRAQLGLHGKAKARPPRAFRDSLRTLREASRPDEEIEEADDAAD